MSRPHFYPAHTNSAATKSKHPHNDSSRCLVISETRIVGRRSRRTRTGNGSVGRSTRIRGLFPTGTSTTASTNTTLTSVSICILSSRGESCNRFKMQMKPQRVEYTRARAPSQMYNLGACECVFCGCLICPQQRAESDVLFCCVCACRCPSSHKKPLQRSQIVSVASFDPAAAPAGHGRRWLQAPPLP